MAIPYPRTLTTPISWARHFAMSVTALAVVLIPGAATATEVEYANRKVATAPPPGAPSPAPLPWKNTARPLLVVLTDIGNEPDDSESFVRLLLYANDIELAGLVATTSASQPNRIMPELLVERIRAYGSVLANLRVHDPAYPSEEKLLSLVTRGSATYGLSGVGARRSTSGSRRIVSVVDQAGDRPVWVAIWGGAADLAQALYDVRATRTPAQVAHFVSRLRVFSISDQDDAGPMLRYLYPKLFWIGSIHAFRDYSAAGWTGFSRDIVLPSTATDASLIDHAWQRKLQGLGPLGALYPLSTGLMEGDTPSFLGLIPNGLNVPARPDYGGWGGRYGQVSAAFGLYSDAADAVTGKDGITQRTAQASIWRWRQAVQHDMLARLIWSVTPERGSANHQPMVMLDGLAGNDPVVIRAHAGDRVELSAVGSTDPDGDALSYRWFQYKEPTFILRTTRTLKLEAADQPQVSFVAPKLEPFAPADYHIVVEVTDSGSPALTRYRRAIVKIEN